MRLVPAYTPDPDYIDRQIDAELAAEHDRTQNPIEQSDTDKIAS
ncbi:hypothetical protein [Rhodococcus sp. 06-235-1A]|nr:hypothetical protein [Rhodococcus sp. 06-235-1A]